VKEFGGFLRGSGKVATRVRGAGHDAEAVDAVAAAGEPAPSHEAVATILRSAAVEPFARVHGLGALRG
jgi:hypothetical protein